MASESERRQIGEKPHTRRLVAAVSTAGEAAVVRTPALHLSLYSALVVGALT